MPILVKILRDNDGEETLQGDQYWHLVVHWTGSQAFCSGEFFGVGESAVEFELKSVARGGITCPECMKKIREIKSVKL